MYFELQISDYYERMVNVGLYLVHYMLGVVAINYWVLRYFVAVLMHQIDTN